MKIRTKCPICGRQHHTVEKTKLHIKQDHPDQIEMSESIIMILGDGREVNLEEFAEIRKTWHLPSKNAANQM